MTCCSCKNLDTKKKASGAVSGTAYMCKKNKSYVLGCNNECDKFANASRDNDSCDKIYREGKDWDNDKTSPGTYIFIGLVLLIILIFVLIFNHDLFGI